MRRLLVRIFLTFVVSMCLAAASQAQIVVEEAFPNLTSFTRPVDLQNAGDGSNRLFVVAQAGSIWVFSNDTLVTEKKLFLDIEPSVDSSDGEEGLLGLVFHPEYPDSPYFYVNYTVDGVPDHSQISRFTVSTNPDSADAGSEFSIMEIPKPSPNHNAGQLAFGADGYLYIATGDGGGFGDPNGNGQNLTTLLGAILRVDVDNPGGGMNYGIPPDNPYVGNGMGYREEIWAHGLRNPWRFSFDTVTDSLWLGDVGQGLWEEVDVIRKGENYGWNTMEGNHCYPSDPCDMTGLTLPVWEYFHQSGRRSITGGYVYRGAKIPDIVGHYIYADYSTGEIWGLEWDGATATNTALLDATDLLSSFGVDEQQELYCTFLIAGRIGKVLRDPQTPVLITSFDGRAFADGVELAWEIYADEGFRGFKVLRAEDGVAERAVSAGLLPTNARGFVDTSARPGGEYRYTLVIVMSDDTARRSATITVRRPVVHSALGQNHPNPFNPSTVIEFTVAAEGFAEVRVYDVRGALVRTLVSRRVAAGAHEAAWNGRGAGGRELSSGVYYYSLRLDGRLVDTRRMVLLK